MRFQFRFTAYDLNGKFQPHTMGWAEKEEVNSQGRLAGGMKDAGSSLLLELKGGWVFSQSQTQAPPVPPQSVLFGSLNPKQGMTTELAIMKT